MKFLDHAVAFVNMCNKDFFCCTPSGSISNSRRLFAVSPQDIDASYSVSCGGTGQWTFSHHATRNVTRLLCQPTVHVFEPIASARILMSCDESIRTKISRITVEQARRTTMSSEISAGPSGSKSSLCTTGSDRQWWELKSQSRETLLQFTLGSKV